MFSGLEALTERPYPGRFIVIGENEAGAGVVVYGITGRSPSSQARRLILREDVQSGSLVEVEVTDPAVLNQGSPALLVYPALIAGRAVSVSNGAQTTDVAHAFDCRPLEALERAHRKWGYEPDAPNFTPRISGRLETLGLHHPDNDAFLGIIRRGAGGLAYRSFFHVPLVRGRGAFISTYDGRNTNPLVSFSGEPLVVAIPSATPAETAQHFYDAFAPREGGNDFRVSVACAYLPSAYKPEIALVNRF